MRKSIILIIIAIVIIGAGFGIYRWIDGKDVKLPETVPDDLVIYYEYYDFMRYFLDKIEGEELTIYSDGRVNLRRGNKGFEAEEQFNLNEEELFKIYQEIVRNDFFGLSESYAEPRAVDGGIETLKITAAGKEHAVSVKNIDVNRFDKCVETIFEVVSDKATPWYVIKDRICSEAESACRIQEEYQNVPCDYWEEECREKVEYDFVRYRGELEPWEAIFGNFEENEQICIQIEVNNSLGNELPFYLEGITIHDHVKLIEGWPSADIDEKIEVSKVDFCQVNFPEGTQEVEGNSSLILDIVITCNDIECMKSGEDDLCWFTVIPQIYVSAFGTEKPLEPVINYNEPTFKIQRQ